MKRLLFTTTICAAMPLAAAAQDAVCQGVAAGAWIGGSAEQSDISTTGAALDTNSFVPVGGEVVSLFTLSSPATIRYEARGSFGGDPIAYLYNQAGAEVSFNDDGATDFGVYAMADLAAGSYCLSVGDVNGGLLPVDIRIGRAEHEALQTPVDDMVQGGSCFEIAGGAPDIDVSAPYTRDFSVSGMEAVTFTLTEPKTLTLMATGNMNDPLLAIESESQGYIAENDDMVGLDARIDLSSPLAPGRYCVSVDTYEQDGTTVELQIKPLDLNELRLQQINSGEASPLIGGDHPITDLGLLGGRVVRDAMIEGDMTWFSVSVATDSVILVDSLAVDGSDPTSVMFDDAGRELARNDDFGADYSSRLIAPVSAGSYLIGVANYNEVPAQTRMIIDVYIRQR